MFNMFNKLKAEYNRRRVDRAYNRFMGRFFRKMAVESLTKRGIEPTRKNVRIQMKEMRG